MKKTKFVILCLFLLVSSNKLKTQIVLNISPNINSGSIYIGKKTNDISPYIGFQYLNSNFVLEQSSLGYLDIISKEPFRKVNEIPSNFYILGLGVKRYFKKTNNTSLYLNVNLNYVKLNSIINQNTVSEAFIKNTLNNSEVFKFEFGLGIEHFISDNFSIGTEFGLNIFRIFTDFKSDVLVYNSINRINETVNLPVSLNIKQGVFNAKINLSYYFETNPTDKSK